MKRTKVGIIGCGMISDTYFKAAQKFNVIEVVACADIIPERSKAKEEMYGVKAMTNDELLAMPEIEIVLNLTPPQVHSKIAIDTLNAGKHAYSEKPFGVDADDAAKVIALAKKKGLRVGCAPDTFLGGGQQTARKLLDDGWIGKPIACTAIVMGRGPEKWGQAPFFYDYGAGPMLDLGPYYVTAMVNLFGPAKSVTAVTIKGSEYRIGGAEFTAPYDKIYKPFDKYPVTVTTHLTGVIEFQNGVVATMIASFEAYRHSHPAIEVYGDQGTMQVPDPNTFDGPVRVYRRDTADWVTAPLSHIYTENSRSIGAADMAIAIDTNRPHRCSGELANHVLEVMLAFDKSSKLGKKVEITTTCKRPEPLPMGLEHGMIDKD
ncbi:MAG: Gfo/Idh/MocA family oxidoreductase [Lentisphaeria bacterium]|nr:Gfo/Idh/MocA family oxidoreductase [Lentisphaeria bacterium]